MEDQERKCVSRSMQIAAQVIILLKVKFVVILEEMEIIYAGSAMLEAHVRSKKVMMDFIVFLRYFFFKKRNFYYSY